MQLIQNEPSWNWTALVSLSRRKHERRQVREASCEVFCSCDSEFAIFPLGAAVWHANCDRHKLPMTAKFCADCDLTLAMDRCSHLAEFQMGYLHEVPPGQVEDTSPENSLRAIKFIFSRHGRHSRLWVCLTTAGASRHRGLFEPNNRNWLWLHWRDGDCWRSRFQEVQQPSMLPVPWRQLSQQRADQGRHSLLANDQTFADPQGTTSGSALKYVA